MDSTIRSPMTLDERLGGAAEHEVGSPRSSTHGAGTHPRSSSSGDGPLESDADETKDITPAQLQHPDEGDELHGVVDDVVDEEEGPAGEERLNIGEKERFEMATQDRRLAHVLCEGRFEQMTVGDFWEHFLRNDAPFNLPQFQEERGDKEMECHMWGAPHAHAEGAANGAAGADGEGGNGRQSPSETAADSQPAGPPGATGQVRSLHFLTPVKAGPVGPSEAPAIKMQRVRRFGDFGMMVDSSVSLDKSVPMADAFTVEDTMTVEQDGVDIKLCITFEVKFKRPIMLKSIIASKSKTDTGSFYQDWLTAAQHYWDRVLHPDTHKARRKSIKKHKPKPDPEKPEKGFLITWLLALVFGIQEGERGRPPTIPLMPYLLAIVFGYLYMFSSPQAPPMVPGVDLGSGLGFGLGSVPPGGAAVPDVIELLQRLDQRLERLEERLGEQGFPPAQPCNPES
uniref:VASt domain-containing protein n=1 Tax=Phaeomonas parva TaxID=124430 RepID=A0A7S1U7G9_9STRA